MLCSSHRNQLDSPLLRLPGELRNAIYEQVLGNWDFRMVYIKNAYPQLGLYCRRVGESGRWQRLTSALTTLLFVCRQIYAEARYLPFTLNVFGGKTMWCLHKLLDRLNDNQRRRVTNVRLVLSRKNMAWDEKGKLIGSRLVTADDARPVFQGLYGLRRVVIAWAGRTGRINWATLRGSLGTWVKGGMYGALNDGVEVRVVRTRRVEDAATDV